MYQRGVGTFLRVWGRVVGEAAMRRALPVWAGVAVLAGVVMGGNGMHPSALTGAALGSWRFGAGLALTWLVLVVPAARAMLDPALTAYLRALPGPRGGRRAVSAAVLLAVQAPWAALWWIGEGPAAGSAAAAGGAAVAAAVAELAGRVRWPHRAPRWRGGLGAVIGAHRRLLMRGRGAAIVRAIGVAWLGGAAAGLIARANQLSGDETVWWTLIVGALALPIAIGALALPVVDGDRRLGWLLRASGCSWPTRVAAAALVLAVVGAGLGVVAAAAAWGIGEVEAGTALALAGWMALLGAGLGGLALRAGVWAGAHGDATRVVVAMAGAAMASFLAIGVLGIEGALAIAAAGGAAAVALATPARRLAEELA
jgi:hypothetical protein